jgi:hypothetical protein
VEEAPKADPVMTAVAFLLLVVVAWRHIVLWRGCSIA